MPIVQIAVSIVISWALFALLCSMVQELVVQVKSERGRFFRTKILEKLYDNSNQMNWGLLMYNHSNIKLLTKSSEAPPSVISSKMLAETLIDSIANAHATQILKNSSNLQRQNFKSDLLNDLEFGVYNLGQSDVIIMVKNYLSKAKVSATNESGYDEEKLYKSLVNDLQIWFDEFGSRTSLWYKKISQKRLFFLGLLVASIANIDSLALVSFFKENPNARKQMESFYFNNQKKLERLTNEYKTTHVEKEALTLEAIQNFDEANTNQKDSIYNALNKAKNALVFKETRIRKDIDSLTQNVESLKSQINLPIGWEKTTCGIKKNNTDCPCTTHTTLSFSCLFFKIIGFILSALAASLGAPFWFDLLKRATTMNLLKK